MAAADAAEYVYLNVGVAETPNPDAVEYTYLNVTEPPSTVHYSDGLQWFWLPDSNVVKGWIADAKEESVFYTNTKTASVILVSPDGTKWKLSVNDDGSLNTTAV